MVTMKKAQNGTKVSVSKVRQVADSLMDASIRKKNVATQQKSIGDATLKNKVADKQVSVSNPRDVDTWGKTLSGRDRLSLADNLKKEASTDSSNSVRYRTLADKAMDDAAPKKKMGGVIKSANSSKSYKKK